MTIGLLRSYSAAGWEVLNHHLLRRTKAYALVGIVLLAGIALYAIFLAPPRDFPEGTIIEIAESASTAEAIQMLSAEKIISSELAFKALARLTGSDRNLHAGKYAFEHPQNALTVLYRLTNGISGIPVVRVTFPEGQTVQEMADTLHAELPSFDTDGFLALASPYEGYLFPDTYDFYGDVTPEEVVRRLMDAFDEKRPLYEKELAASGRSLEEIVVMASLLEREAQDLEDRRTIAGILWSRLENDMALQVDAVFGYIRGTKTYSPSLEDLEIDSPYNTYRYRGLPPGPIANPGLDSLIAAATPIETPYVYYLTGRDGKMYYANTFDEHKGNRALYLD